MKKVLLVLLVAVLSGCAGHRSMTGAPLVEVRYVRESNGGKCILENVQTKERFEHKGNFGDVGEVFYVERPYRRN